MLKGAAWLEEIDARLIQPYYAKRLAEAAGMPLSLALDGADVVVSAIADVAGADRRYRVVSSTVLPTQLS